MHFPLERVTGRGAGNQLPGKREIDGKEADLELTREEAKEQQER